MDGSSTPLPANADAGQAALANVWLVVALALVLVTFMGCLCSFLFYYKMNHFRRTATVYPIDGNLGTTTFGSASVATIESLPNYTLVSGLPSYDEALAQYQKTRFYLTFTGHYFTYSGRMKSKRVSINDLLENYKRRASTTSEPTALTVTPGQQNETVV